MQAPSGNAYLRYYERQAGGSFDYPVFRGGQHGAGLGDIMRGIWRFVSPVLLRGVSSFAGNMEKNRSHGMSWKDSAKSSIMPTLGAVGSAVMNRNGSQEGSGMALRSALFSGERGIPYKNGGAKQPKKHKKLRNTKKASHHRAIKSSDGALNF